MEKTKKVNTKPAKKAAVKEKEGVVKEVVKSNDEVTIKNQINYTKVLNKIYITLVVIATILFISLVANIFVSPLNSSSKSTDEKTTQTSADYDVSQFNEMTVDEFLTKMKEGGTEVLYVGRPSCGYCVQFVPIMKEAQKDLGFKHNYIDLEKISSEDSVKLTELDSYIEDNFGFTPMVLVFKDGKFVNGTVGYTELGSYKSFLNEQGIK